MSTNFEDTKWHSYTSSTETMRTWAVLVESYEDIPVEFQPAFPEYKDHFPYTLFIPEDKKTKHRQQEKKMICLYEDYFVFSEFQQDELQTLSSKFTDVVYLERGKVLLNSWLMIETTSGTASLRFNTTNNYLFQPIIDKIRQGMVHPNPYDAASGKEIEDNSNLSKFDYLDKINFKYMNYGRTSIRDDDSVIDVIYEPEHNIQEVSFFSKTIFRRYKTNHLTILTEQELILIREYKRIRNNFDLTNGGVFIYIPRCKIEDVSFISNQEDSLSTMQISLPGNVRLTTEFSSDHEELNQLQRMSFAL